MNCNQIKAAYGDEINEIINTQMEENREAIFFFYEDGSTSGIFKGKATQISLSREEEARVMSQGKLKGSVHSHPTGFDPSTIDIMTGLMSSQESMCVAVPIHEESIDDDFVLTCLDLSGLKFPERRRMMAAMRRNSIGVTEMGRDIRKQASLKRFSVEGCRTHKVEVDGVKFSPTKEPDPTDFSIGRQLEASEDDRRS